jgi:uncharacterized protein (DUF433 family)
MRPRPTLPVLCLLATGLLFPAGAHATDPAAGMQRIGKVTLSNGLYRSLYNGLIDPVQGFGYFTTAAAENPGWLIKVDLSGPLPVEVAAIPMQPGEGNLLAGAVDPLAGYAYIGITGSPGRVIKIALGQELSTGVIDPLGGFAFFGSDHTHPAKIYKVALGTGDALPTEAGVLQLDPGSLGTGAYPPDGGNITAADAGLYGEIYLQSSVLAFAGPGDAFGYFGTDTGKPTFRSTRILVADVLEQIADGMAWETIIQEWHGSISREAIAEVLQLATRALLEHVDDYVLHSA